MKVHYLQHVPFEGPGSISRWTDNHGFPLTSTKLYANETLPSSDEIDLLIIIGGPMNIYEEDRYPWLSGEKRFIQSVIERGSPVIGICLGAQLVAHVLGADIYPNPHKEIGWFQIHKTPAAAASELSSVFPESVDAFHWHGDTYDLPPDTIHLVRSEACENQGFIYDDRVVGIQFHLETTVENAENLMVHCKDEMVDGPHIQTPEEILSFGAEDRFNKINKIMNRLLDFLAFPDKLPA